MYFHCLAVLFNKMYSYITCVSDTRLVKGATLDPGGLRGDLRGAPADQVLLSYFMTQDVQERAGLDMLTVRRWEHRNGGLSVSELDNFVLTYQMVQERPSWNTREITDLPVCAQIEFGASVADLVKLPLVRSLRLEPPDLLKTKYDQALFMYRKAASVVTVRGQALRDFIGLIPPGADSYYVQSAVLCFLVELRCIMKELMKWSGQTDMFGVLLLASTWQNLSRKRRDALREKIGKLAQALQNYLCAIPSHFLQILVDHFELSVKENSTRKEDAIVLMLDILYLSQRLPSDVAPVQHTSSDVSVEELMKQFPNNHSQPGPSKKTGKKKASKTKATARQQPPTSSPSVPWSPVLSTFTNKDVESGDWEVVTKRKAKSLMETVQQYYNISKLQHYQNYAPPRLDKMQGRVVVYSRPDNARHYSLVKSNLPSGAFHITNEVKPVRRWYFDDMGQLRHCTTDSRSCSNSTLPPNIAGMASSFAGFLKEARL